MSATAKHQLSVEQRLAALEQRMENLTALNGNGSAKKDWRRTVGMFTDDPEMQGVFADAMKLRETDRKKARRRQGKRHRVKS